MLNMKESKNKIGRHKILPGFIGWVRNSTMLFVIILLGIIFSIVSPYFFSASNIFDITRQIAVLALAALGVTFVIITGGIDISIGSVVGLGGVTMVALCNFGIPVPVSFFLSALIGAFIGFLNGIMIIKGKITPLIATLVTMNIARGMVYAYTKGSSIGINRFQDQFNFIAQGNVYSIPFPLIIVVIIFAIGWIVLNKSIYGTRIIAVGNSEVASRFSGINVSKIKYFVYIISGLCAAIAGIVFASRVSSGQQQAGIGLEFQAITVVVIGGTSLSGGRGSVWSTLIGAVVLGVLANGMNLMNISYYYQLLLQGLIIIIAVSIDQFRRSS